MTEVYSVGAYKEFENKFGMIMEEQVSCRNVHTPEDAEKLASELANAEGYSAVYISFNHGDSSCFYNPTVGFSPVGKNWISHLS